VGPDHLDQAAAGGVLFVRRACRLVVQAGHAAAVLPDLAAVDFDSKRFTHEPIQGLKPRTLVRIANARNLDWLGCAAGIVEKLAERLVPD
jgi:hypothetical protein